MQGVLTVDRLEVLVVVDNATDSLSSNPKSVIPEWTGLLTGGRMRMVSGHGICCAHHGLSLLITAHRGSESHTLLFDAGPEDATFLRNAAVLGIQRVRPTMHVHRARSASMPESGCSLRCRFCSSCTRGNGSTVACTRRPGGCSEGWRWARRPRSTACIVD